MWREIGKTVRKAMDDSDMTLRFVICVVSLAAAVALVVVVATAV